MLMKNFGGKVKSVMYGIFEKGLLGMRGRDHPGRALIPAIGGLISKAHTTSATSTSTLITRLIQSRGLALSLKRFVLWYP